MEILEPSPENIARAGACIAAGGLVAIPTETVYGLGCNALDARAVARVFVAKERPGFDPLIVHVLDLAGLERVAWLPNAKARTLAERLWPGPLTLILPRRDELPALVTSGLPTVAVRIPSHPVARAVIAAAGLPVAAPSANPFGRLSPTRAGHVARGLGDRVDLILDGGPCAVGLESTVLDVTVDPPLVLRPGGMSRAAIEAVIGPVALLDRNQALPTSPGQLPSHYAPRTPLHLVRAGGLMEAGPRGRAAALCADGASRAALEAAASSGGAHRFAAVRVLAESGDPVEAAANLFALLHELDGAGYDEIWAERLPERGLGVAVNDRLWKASIK